MTVERTDDTEPTATTVTVDVEGSTVDETVLPTVMELELELTEMTLDPATAVPVVVVTTPPDKYVGDSVGLDVGRLEGESVGLGTVAACVVNVTARLPEEAVAAVSKVTTPALVSTESTVPETIPLVADTAAPTEIEVAAEVSVKTTGFKPDVHLTVVTTL